MEQQNDMLKSIANLSEEERLALFNVEELENRLEMGGIRFPLPWPLPPINLFCDNGCNTNGTCNSSCPANPSCNDVCG